MIAPDSRHLRTDLSFCMTTLDPKPGDIRRIEVITVMAGGGAGLPR
jgi:hypothetical protein